MISISSLRRAPQRVFSRKGYLFNVRTMTSNIPGDEKTTSFGSVETMANSPPVDTLPALATSELAPFSLSSHPFDMVCHILDTIHTTLDVPYFGAIMITTVTLRTLLFPLQVSSLRNAANLHLASPEITEYQKKYKELAAKNAPTEEIAVVAKKMKDVFTKYNCNPLRSFTLPLFQMPIFLSMFFGIQRMGDYFPGFAKGGFGIFENLSVADPTYILPALNGLSFLLIIETNSDIDTSPHGPMIKTAFRAMAVGMPFATYYFPMGVFVYWITNNCFTMVQGALLRMPEVKIALNIPIIARNKQGENNLPKDA